MAYKRFADNIPLALDLELVQGAEHNILGTLYSNLGINGQDGVRICKELAQESPQIADRRTDLLKKLERLEIASDELLHVGSWLSVEWRTAEGVFFFLASLNN